MVLSVDLTAREVSTTGFWAPLLWRGTGQFTDGPGEDDGGMGDGVKRIVGGSVYHSREEEERVR